MVEPGAPSTILWDTLKLSAEPLRGRSGILVVAQIMVSERGHKAADQYRVNFEMNRQHGLVSQDTEVMVSGIEGNGPRWRYSGRRDVVDAIKRHFLTTQLYSHVASQLGWVSSTERQVSQAPLDP
jgi:hypothetical protein